KEDIRQEEVEYRKIVFRNSYLILERSYKTSANCDKITRKEGFVVSKKDDKVSNIAGFKIIDFYNKEMRGNKFGIRTVKKNKYNKVSYTRERKIKVFIRNQSSVYNFEAGFQKVQIDYKPQEVEQVSL
ncbi:7581_t:CDS:1, partial [Racocetra fulgida]